MFTLLPFTLTFFFTATFQRISADLSSPLRAAEAPGSPGEAHSRSPRADQSCRIFSEDKGQRWELDSKGTRSYNSALGRKSESLDALHGSSELWAFFEFIMLISAPKWQGLCVLFEQKKLVSRLLHINTYTGIVYFFPWDLKTVTLFPFYSTFLW